MHSELNSAKLAAMIRTKRRDRGLRVVAAEIDVSAATLSRVEQGKLPDVETFMRLCRWLGVEPSEFGATKPTEKDAAKQSTPDLIEAHLRADRTLSSDTAEALVQMIRLAYRKQNRK